METLKNEEFPSLVNSMLRRPFHVGCELTGLGICYCAEGTPESLRDPVAGDTYCERAEQVHSAWKKEAIKENQPEETHILLPVLYKRNDLGEKMVQIEGLRAAEEEEKSARESAELLASKAAQKANLLGISHTLLSDLEMEVPRLDTNPEEGVDEKLNTIQKSIEEVRNKIREMEKKQEDLFASQELESRHIGQNMEIVIDKLELIKDKLPPDRLQEAMLVKESASGILIKSRKSTRKHRKLLKNEDISESLVGSWLSVYWPDDNQWWNVYVQKVNSTLSTATLLYETEEAEEIDLKQLVEKGELAWLDISGNGGHSNSNSDHPRKKKRHH